jgi:GT2 family glycosyltransferase
MDPVVDLSVVIVSWNVREHLRANLARLLRQDHGLRLEVFVVDNGSVDGTRHMVRTEFPEATLIANDYNAGFAKANNQALRLAKGTVCLLLNPDMLVEPGSLKAAHDRVLADRTIGVLGIKLLGEDGKPVSNVRRFPDLTSQLLLLLKLNRLFPRAMDRYMAADFDYSRTQDVDQVRGAFFLFRRELLASVGLLDEGYFLWFEEVDFCKRAKAAGLRVEYFAEATARDFVGRSFAQVRHLWKQRHFGGSMARYFAKWAPRWQWLLVQLARPVGLLGAGLGDVAKHLVGRSARVQVPPPAPTQAPASSRPTLALLLPLYEGSSYLPYLLPSLRSQTDRDWHLCVVEDRSPSPDERQRARALVEASGIPHTFVDNAHNMRFAPTLNRLAGMANADYVQLINQDAVLGPDYVAKVRAYMDAHPECASAAGTILRWDFDRRDEADGGRTDVVDSLGLHPTWIGEVFDKGAGTRDDAAARTGTVPVLGVSGCLPMYRMSAVREASMDGSLFDGAFVAYKEDVDLALRLRALGYASAVVRDALSWHRRTLKARGGWYMKFVKQARPIDYLSYRNHSWMWHGHAGHPWRFVDACRVPYELSKMGYWLFRKPAFLRQFFVDTWQRRAHLRARRQHIAELHRIGRSRPPRAEASVRHDVVVVTVPLNRLDSLASLQRARAASSLRTAYVAVDNGSTAFDAHARVTSEMPDAHVLLRGHNRGFGSSNNRGAALLEADYVLFLNPDTELVDPTAIDRLHAFMEKNPHVGIVAPRLTYTDGRTQETVRRFPSWYMPIVQRTSLGRTAWGRREAARFLMADDAHDRIRPVDWAQGSALFVRADVLRRVGGFDDLFFLYYEDIDLCRRVWNLGYHVTYHPGVTIQHTYTKDSAKLGGSVANLLGNPVARWHVASGCKYILKWAFRRTPNADRVPHSYAS